MGKQKNTHLVIFNISAYIILLGTAYDVFWCVLTVETLAKDELNPIAKWIISIADQISQLNHAGVATLCLIKIMTTWKVIWICKYLLNKRPKIGLTCIISLAIFQILLAIFLTYYPNIK